MSEKIKVFQKELPLRESGKFRLDAHNIEVDEAHEPKFADIKNREDKIFAALKDSETVSIERKVNLDAAETKIKTLEKELESAVPSGEVETRLDAKLELWDLAGFLGIKDFKNQTDTDLQKSIIKLSDRFDEADIENPEYRKFCIKNLSTDHSKKVLKSKANLESSPSFNKFDSSADDEESVENA